MSLKLVFFGTPDFAVPTLRALLNRAEMEVTAVVTQPDRRRGRGARLIPSPVKQAAVEAQIPVWQPPRLRKCSQTLTQLAEIQADAFVVVAYGQLLPPAVLTLPRLGCVNVHGSLLPHYRGAAPIQWSLCRGDRETGITTMLMDEGMDTGAMLLKAPLAVPFLANAEEVAETLAQIGADLLIKTLIELKEGILSPEPQDEGQATYAPLLKKEDFALSWSRSALDLHHQIRGFYPHCFSQWQGQTLKILSAVPLEPDYYSLLPPDLSAALEAVTLPQTVAEPGTLVAGLKSLGPVIQTGAGLLLLREVQLPGKRPQSGWDWVNGRRLQVGERLFS
ncbi:MAG: methionyl-tRNA formyltransferase [Cyanobacteria bacterium RI_101]|nr:methionyl-tRNA formyltransferase [Cyanobacteria bacterium RI_101]